jgi:hypothetical protein
MFTLTVFYFIAATAAIYGTVVQIKTGNRRLAAAFAVIAIALTGLVALGIEGLARSNDPMDWIAQPVPCDAQTLAIGC